MSGQVAESKIITINSSNAEKLNGNLLSNIIFNFRDVVKTTLDTTHTISLQSVEMPFSIYNIDYNRNTIALRITLANGTITNHTLTLTQGNYNANTFRTEVIGKFLAETTFNILMEISPTTGVYNLTPSNALLQNVIILFNGTTCKKVIGLTQDITFPFNLTTPSNFDYPANFLGVKKLSLYSDALAGNNIDSKSLGENTLINTISVNAPAWGLITYNNASLNESILRNTFINRIDLQIRDEEGLLVDFNNTDYEMSFILRTYRQYQQNLRVGGFSDLVRNERRDDAIREIIQNPIYKDAPILDKVKQLQAEEKLDTRDYQDTELNILLD